MDQNGTTGSPRKIASAIGAAQAQSALPAAVRFPGEDGGQSLGEMAQRDLDAALQLLADRAQYITGATGAAIALRRDGMADMLCRASTGTNAPELGALLSTEFGLSGESVRTKRALRCDDAERDARVNHEVCRQLGIASVVVMPVVNDDQVLGVFELFSGKANAFGERDLTAIQRLSEMVETAVRLAHAGESVTKKQPGQGNAAVKQPDAAVQEGQFISDLVVDRKVDRELPGNVTGAAAAPTSGPAAAKAEVPVDRLATATAKVTLSKKPLFWSAARNPEGETVKAAQAEQSHVPPVLRGLRKCEACGFPVTEGRSLCVECEEKKWRGQLRQSRSAAVSSVAVSSSPFAGQPSAGAAPGVAKEPSASAQKDSATRAAVVAAAVQVEPAKSGEVSADHSSPSVTSIRPEQNVPNEHAARDVVLSAGVQPSQSWLTANKYILCGLFVIAAAAALVYFLR